MVIVNADALFGAIEMHAACLNRNVWAARRRRRAQFQVGNVATNPTIAEHKVMPATAASQVSTRAARLLLSTWAMKWLKGT
jgi:hypothetical protein